MDVACTPTYRTPQGWARWTVSTGCAEAVGLAAAAAAAAAGFAVVGEPDSIWGATVVVCLAVLGGLVEGSAVGLVQAHFLASWLPTFRKRRYVEVTALAAAVGWYLGMLPSVLVSLLGSADKTVDAGTSGGPSTAAMALVGVVVGAVMGSAFGGAQAWVLVASVARPGRWVIANGVGWAGAMAIIFAGASGPSGPWPWQQLMVLGAATGLAAGLVIGGVTGLCVGWLVEDAPAGSTRVNSFVLFLLRSPLHRLLSATLVELRYRGRRTGRWYALPVQYAQEEELLVVIPGSHRRKTWWRNFTESQDVQILLRGEKGRAVAEVVLPDDEPRYSRALASYRGRFRRIALTGVDPIIAITLAEIKTVSVGDARVGGRP